MDGECACDLSLNRVLEGDGCVCDAENFWFSDEDDAECFRCAGIGAVVDDFECTCPNEGTMATGLVIVR